jgi:membrane protease YdiL (CAAX protease family)
VVWEGLSAAVVIAILGRIGWLRKVGFTRFSHWRSRYLLWWVTPFVLSAIVVDQKVSLSGGFDIAVAAVLTFLLALNEEAIFRGAILQALLPRGARRAIIIQGSLFGAFHAVNLIGGDDPRYVAVQIVVVACNGIFLGALRVRLQAIWPVIAIHGILDFGIIVSKGYSFGVSSPPLGTAINSISFYLGLATIAVVLLARPSKLRTPAVTAIPRRDDTGSGQALSPRIPNGTTEEASPGHGVSEPAGSRLREAIAPLLTSGETILWTAAPAPKPLWRLLQVGRLTLLLLTTEFLVAAILSVSTGAVGGDDAVQLLIYASVFESGALLISLYTIIGAWRGQKSTVVAVTDRRLVIGSARTNKPVHSAPLVDIAEISIDRPEQTIATVRFGKRAAYVNRRGLTAAAFQPKASVKAIEFVDIANPDKLRDVVLTAVPQARQVESSAPATLSDDARYVWDGQYWRLAVFSPDGSWVWDGRYWRSRRPAGGPALLPSVRALTPPSVSTAGGPRSGSGMGGFIVGGIVLVFGLMALIGGIAQPNLEAFLIGCVMTGVGGVVCGATVIVRERNPTVLTERAAAWTNLVARTWPDVLDQVGATGSVASGSALPTVLRPRLGAYLKARGISLRRWQFIAFILFLLLVSWPRDWRWPLVGLPGAAMLVAAEFVRERIDVDSSRLTIQQVIRRRSFQLRDLGGVIFASTSFFGQTRRQAILFGKGGQKLHAFPVEMWDEKEVRAAFASAGIMVHGNWEVVPWSVTG